MKRISVALIILVLMLPGYAFASVDVLAGGWWDASIEELLSAREQIDTRITALGGELPNKKGGGEQVIESDEQTTNDTSQFDIFPFENQDFCEIIVDDIEPFALIRSVWYGRGKTGMNDANLDDGITLAYISPDVFVSDYRKDTELPVFRIVIDYMEDNWLFADSVSFKIGDSTYTFSNLGNDDYRHITPNGYVSETLIILIGDEDMEFIEELYNYEHSIQVRIKGSKGTSDFKVYSDDLFFNDLRQMYEAMLAAGGFNQAYLKRVPESTMSVK